jgi:glycosyltransferase involved in cell wall biosynthesis
VRVALVHPTYFDATDGHLGGAERYVQELAAALSRDAQVRVVTTGARRRTFWRDGVEMHVYPALARLRGVAGNPLTLGFVRSLESADVIHCHSHGTVMSDLAILYGRYRRVPVLLTSHGGGSSVTLARVAPIGRLSAGNLPVTRFAAAAIPLDAPALDPLYAGVDPGMFHPSAVERESLAVFVGRILPHKGLDLLVRALPAGMRLEVHGQALQPDYLDHLRGLAGDRPVQFLLDGDDAAIAAAYRRAAVVVLPSVYEDYRGHRTGIPELLGIVLLEAMACGTPVICSDAGGMPEVVSDGVTGWVVPSGSEDALREALLAVMNAPDHGQARGHAGAELVRERFLWEHVATRAMAAYRSVLA